MPAPRAGDRRNYVTIQERTTEQDAAGQPKKVWHDLHRNVPAEVRLVAGGETFRGQQMQATTTHIVTLDFIDGIKDAHRFVYGSEVLNITRAGDPDGMRRKLLCECKADAA